MISFLKKWRSAKPENESEQPMIQEEKLVEEEARSESDVDPETSMQLVFPMGKVNPIFLPDEVYVFRFAFSELPELETGVFAIDGYKLEQTMLGFSVLAFLRNSMDEPIKLEKLPVVLKDAVGTVIASNLFTMGEEGTEIPAQSCMPWRFKFPYDSFAVSTGDLASWHLEFHMEGGKTHARVQELDFDTTGQTWGEQHIKTEEQILSDIRQALVQTEGLVHAIGVSVNMKDNGDIEVVVALRNGRNEAIMLEADTVFTVYDAMGEVVASHSFDLSNVELSAFSAIPYTLLFPQASLQKQSPDFNEWSITQE